MATERQSGRHPVSPVAYEIRHLTEAQVCQAFPLVREIARALTMVQWQRYAMRLLAGGRGLRRESGIVIAHAQGSIYIRGLCAYRLFPDLIARDRLIAGCFAVPTTIDCASVARELIAACGSIAAAHDCCAVQVHLVERNQWIGPLLHGSGYAADRGAYIHVVPGYRPS